MSASGITYLAGLCENHRWNYMVFGLIMTGVIPILFRWFLIQGEMFWAVLHMCCGWGSRVETWGSLCGGLFKAGLLELLGVQVICHCTVLFPVNNKWISECHFFSATVIHVCGNITRYSLPTLTLVNQQLSISFTGHKSWGLFTLTFLYDMSILIIKLCNLIMAMRLEYTESWNTCAFGG